MSDFFSEVKDGLNGQQNLPDDTQTFAEAIAARFGQTDNVLTARLLNPVIRIPSTPMANLSIQRPPVPSPQPETTIADEHGYTAVAPQALSQWLDDPHTLVIDIRPHAAYSSARIARAVSLSVPSTLLKRPLFSLQRLSAMLPSQAARSRFSGWRTAQRIIVYDADTTTLSDTSNIQGLLRKFRAEAPDAPIALGWIQGGFQAVWALRRDLVDAVPPTPETETEDDDDEPAGPQRVLRAHNLPRAAFALTSTTQGPRSAGNPAAAFNPFFDAVRQNAELTQGITERIPLRLPRRVRRRVSELPFQWLRDIARRAAPVTPPDGNINMNAGSMGNNSAYAPPAATTHSPFPSSPSTPNHAHTHHARASDVEEGTEALAMQFYRIELAEQRRMMNVMEHHSRESGGGGAGGPSEGGASGSASSARGGHGHGHGHAHGHGHGNGNGNGHAHGRGAFPFSITAGVEKGSKNRYRNIWPFEHARVRLHRLEEEHDDYVNASYVQPLGTRRRYIATQGPLEATFGDFWTLVWQQNIHVIVMLTREIEGAMVKCGLYWRAGVYGPLRVELLGCAADGCTGVSPTQPARQLIKRTLRLTHAAHPSAPPRRVVQLQYLGWPDMNVPEDARGVLGLVWEVGKVVDELGVGAAAESEVDNTTGVLRRALRAGDAAAPVLLHCSAGVGRTGGFIAVDAVLDAVRQEARELYGASTGAGVRTGSGEEQDDRMEVDVVDPIWEVVQDMREQRMSLCQSLRQYVFVHAAIIEGALLVVDEERARAGAAWRMPVPSRRGGIGARPRPTLFMLPSPDGTATSSTGKRLASPTELPKEDKKGEIALSKRPSIKRKQMTGDNYTAPMPTYPPP
ncbi:hypothetical protein C8R47DRAFT_970018 [Mycena vitilis]|nr:hypothetical protein C8R47DRAFT_970018 [Mycena vitilis]